MMTKSRVIVLAVFTLTIAVGRILYFKARMAPKAKDTVKVTTGVLEAGSKSLITSERTGLSSATKNLMRAGPARLPSSILKLNQNMQLKYPMPAVEITKIQQQLRHIIEVNKTLKTLRAGQIAEVSRIHDQARIHQRILKDLLPPARQEPVTKDSAEEILRQEKLRLIQEQANRNQEILREIKQQDEKKK